MNVLNALTSLPLDPATLPWIPLAPGESFKPLRFFPNGRALLLRLEPGTVVERHRHHGEVHAFNLSGTRLLIDTDDVVGPGGYVFEPNGNVDSWKAIGDEPVIVLIVSFGAMDYIGPDNEVLVSHSPSSLRDTYLRYCEEHGLTPLELQ
jgi:2,4'-dihydroxyacetophenone dioxygenase